MHICMCICVIYTYVCTYAQCVRVCVCVCVCVWCVCVCVCVGVGVGVHDCVMFMCLHPIALCLSSNIYLGIKNIGQIFMTDEMSSFCLAHIYTSQFDVQFTY